MIIVETGDPRAPHATALLRASHALMESLFPSEANHYLSVDALVSPDIHFMIARRETVTLGCGALAVKNGYGELKSFFVEEASRGQGIADALLRTLEDKARELDLPMLKLETGSLLHAAHKVYARHGFAACRPFGDYVESEFSLFMEKPL
jgi:putative acetyltransferase